MHSHYMLGLERLCHTSELYQESDSSCNHWGELYNNIITILYLAIYNALQRVETPQSNKATNIPGV